MTCRHDNGKSNGPLCLDCAPARLYAEAVRACAVAGVDLPGLERVAREVRAIEPDDCADALREHDGSGRDCLTAWPPSAEWDARANHCAACRARTALAAHDTARGGK